MKPSDKIILIIIKDKRKCVLIDFNKEKMILMSYFSWMKKEKAEGVFLIAKTKY